MKRIRYLGLLILLVLMFVPTVHAENTAQYIVEYQSHNPDTHIYTAEVYLKTSEYISAGTFGIVFNGISADFVLDENNFAIFQDYSNADKNYKAFQWYMKDIPDLTGKIHLGTITVSNVIIGDDGIPEGWNKSTIRLLNWYDTPESAEDMFTCTDDGVCLNDEIFNRETGLYQGMTMDNEENPVWIDIGFVFDSGYELPDWPVAKYVIEYNSYDADTQKYTLDVYLDTYEYLSAGTIGIKYDDSLNADFKLDENNFTLFNDYSKAEKKYIALQWYLNDVPKTGKIHLGNIVIDNVTIGANNVPEGWTASTIQTLNWYDTPESSDEKFSIDEDGVCLNKEIFRQVEYTDVSGYYQGYDMEDENDPKWVDIDLVVNLNLEPTAGITISGTIKSYNPKNNVIISLYNGSEKTAYTTTVSDSPIGLRGEVLSNYEIANVSEGTYRLVIQKDVHLTYEKEITVTNNTTIEEIKLICGDINGDGRIKFTDRAELMRFFNHQNDCDDDDDDDDNDDDDNEGKREFVKADLNGDDEVNAFDLELLKSNLEKNIKNIF